MLSVLLNKTFPSFLPTSTRGSVAYVNNACMLCASSVCKMAFVSLLEYVNSACMLCVGSVCNFVSLVAYVNSACMLCAGSTCYSNDEVTAGLGFQKLLGVKHVLLALCLLDASMVSDQSMVNADTLTQ